MLPLPGGGVGGVDAACTFALTLVGVPLGPAVAGTSAARLFTFWLPLAPRSYRCRRCGAWRRTCRPCHRPDERGMLDLRRAGVG